MKTPEAEPLRVVTIDNSAIRWGNATVRSFPTPSGGDAAGIA